MGESQVVDPSRKIPQSGTIEDGFAESEGLDQGDDVVGGGEGVGAQRAILQRYEPFLSTFVAEHVQPGLHQCFSDPISARRKGNLVQGRSDFVGEEGPCPREIVLVDSVDEGVRVADEGRWAMVSITLLRISIALSTIPITFSSV